MPLQGISLLPIFKGKERQGHQALFNEHIGAKYFRSKGWELVQGRGNLPGKSVWNLYHIAEDQTETKDLASQYPDKVAELKIIWGDWQAKNQVLKTKQL